MLSAVVTLGGAIVNGISGYFKTKQEIKKVKVEAEKKVIAAEAEAKIKRMGKEADQDFTLDQLAMKNMDKSWKDELLLIIWLIPVIMCFIPDYAKYIEDGFNVLKTSTPDWYQWILIAMVVVIYGLRGLLRAVLHLIINNWKDAKVGNKD